MVTKTSESHVKKCLLVWSTPIPDEVRALFTMVFMNIYGLVNYVSKVLTKTDTFHLIIPLNCLGDLLKDPVYQYPQVTHIDIICDSFKDVKSAKHRFHSECEKVQFCTIHHLLTSNKINGSTKDAIISLIESRILAKQSDMSIRRYQIAQQFASTSLHGFPVENMVDFAPCFICPSCKLVYQQAYQLECRHQQCQVCVNIQKRCATCFEAVSQDKVSLNQSSQMKMQDLPAHCSECDRIQPLKDYEKHLKENHYELITCFVRNQQVDENVFHQQYLTETNQEGFVDNLSSSDLDKTVVSLNGTCIWEVSDIGDITNDAISGKRKSIYSAPFYLFPNGYKMCLRLFLNGDDNTRGTHLSLFLVIMRGNYDEHLHWPFKFKVTFTLLNQLQSNNNHSNFFWSNITSTCFQRPSTNMNGAYGFSKFFPRNVFQENENRFARDNTAFFKVEVDFLAKIPEMVLNSNANELMNDAAYDDATDDNILAMICPPEKFNDAPQSN